MADYIEEGRSNYRENRDIALADILINRFNRAIKEKKIENLEEIAKDVGGWWYVPVYRTVKYKDGTWDEIPRNFLKDWLEKKIRKLPERHQLERLEIALGFERWTILNYMEVPYNGDIEKYLTAHGYMKVENRKRFLLMDKIELLKTSRKHHIKQIAELKKIDAARIKEEKKQQKILEKQQRRRITQKFFDLFDSVKDDDMEEIA